jgi:hypothetical protein
MFSWTAVCQSIKHSPIWSGSLQWYQTGVLSSSVSRFGKEIIHREPNREYDGWRWQPFVFHQKLLGEDVDALLLLFFCQNPEQKSGCVTVYGQLFRQNLLVCRIIKSHILKKIWVIRRRFWWTSYWIRATISVIMQLVFLLVCSSSSTDVRPVLNRTCHWNTCRRVRIWSQKARWNIVRVSGALFPILAQKLRYTHCSFIWSMMEIVKLTYTTPNKRVWKLPTFTQYFV